MAKQLPCADYHLLVKSLRNCAYLSKTELKYICDYLSRGGSTAMSLLKQVPKGMMYAEGGHIADFVLENGRYRPKYGAHQLKETSVE